MKIILDSKFRPINPSPVALVTSIDKAGNYNIVTLGEVFNVSISDPVIVGIAIRPFTYSYLLIKDSGEFVINLATAALVEKVDLCGSMSGRNGFNKFQEFGLTAIKASIVKPPLIKECPINMQLYIRMMVIGFWER